MNPDEHGRYDSFHPNGKIGWNPGSPYQIPVGSYQQQTHRYSSHSQHVPLQIPDLEDQSYGTLPHPVPSSHPISSNRNRESAQIIGGALWKKPNSARNSGSFAPGEQIDMPTETSFLPQTSRAPAFLINPGSGTYEDHIPYTPDSYEEHYHHSPTSSFGGDFGNYGYGLDPSPRYHYGQTHNQQDNWTGHNTLPHNQTNQSPLYVPVTTSPLPYDETQEKTETYQKPTKLKSKPPEEIARYVTEIEEALTDLQDSPESKDQNKSTASKDQLIKILTTVSNIDITEINTVYDRRRKRRKRASGKNELAKDFDKLAEANSSNREFWMGLKALSMGEIRGEAVWAHEAVRIKDTALLSEAILGKTREASGILEDAYYQLYGEKLEGLDVISSKSTEEAAAKLFTTSGTRALYRSALEKSVPVGMHTHRQELPHHEELRVIEERKAGWAENVSRALGKDQLDKDEFYSDIFLEDFIPTNTSLSAALGTDGLTKLISLSEGRFDSSEKYALYWHLHSGDEDIRVMRDVQSLRDVIAKVQTSEKPSYTSLLRLVSRLVRISWDRKRMEETKEVYSMNARQVEEDGQEAELDEIISQLPGCDEDTVLLCIGLIRRDIDVAGIEDRDDENGNGDLFNEIEDMLGGL